LADFKAAAAAAGLTPAEQKEMEALNKTLSVHRELSNLPQKVAQQAYASKSPDQQAALKRIAGEENPVTKPQRGWLGTAWHYTGGALLAGLTEVSDLSTRAYRTGAIALMEGKNLGDAWTTANDKGDKVFNPGRINKATSRFGNDRIQVAMRVAAGEKLSDIAASGTDTQKQIAAMAAQNKDDLFQDALDAVQAAKYSPGRQVANLITPESVEGSGFFYRAVSGAFDAAYRVLADPLLVAGKAKRAVDVSRYSLDVVIGGNKVDQVFAQPQVANFWNTYGAELGAYKKAIDAGATKEAVVIKQRLQRRCSSYKCRYC
jgi:protein-disulfide isomerase-like protein with CxxC motif